MNDLRRIIGEAIGEASLQWTPRPAGAFDSASASALIDRTVGLIEAQFAEVCAVLRQLEWAGPVQRYETCLLCHGNRDEPGQFIDAYMQYGHAPDCPLKKCLEAIRALPLEEK